MSKKKVVASVAVSGLMAASIGANGAVAFAQDAQPQDGVAPWASQVAEGVASALQQVSEVHGTFAFTQAEVSTSDEIARAVDASKYLCGGIGAETTNVSAEDWTISLGGDVGCPYAMTIAEMQADPEVQQVLMGCSCLANPAGGSASFNAHVTGVAMKTLVDKAVPSANANTIVFTSADGYEVALPLEYVTSRYCPIVFDVNGSPLCETVGGTNQLWLGSTSAKYFARDIVAIDIQTRQTPPPSPASAEAQSEYSNLPNIGVTFGGDAE